MQDGRAHAPGARIGLMEGPQAVGPAQVSAHPTQEKQRPRAQVIGTRGLAVGAHQDSNLGPPDYESGALTG